MSFQVANPRMFFLALLIAAGAAWVWTVLRNRDRRLAAMLSPAMQVKLCPRLSSTRMFVQLALVAAGLILCVLAAARPQWGMREETVYQRGRDLVIALDVSRSMLASDVRPNRLQRAKADLMDLIKELRGDRAALIAFRRKAVLLCPLTTDYAYLRQALEAADVDAAPRGETDIGDAIEKAMTAFDSDEGSHRAIILISDGEDLSGRAVELAQEAGRRNIPIFTVGLGNREGARIPDASERGGFTTYKGESVLTKLDNETLYAIAKATGGVYVPIEMASLTSVTLGTLYRDHLRKISAQELEETLQRRTIERFQIFLFPGVALLMAAAFLSRGRLSVHRESAANRRDEKPPAVPLKDLTPPKRELKPV